MESPLDTLPDVIYLLIQQFVQRQQLSLEVIREFRPHLVDSTKRRPSKEYASATQLGYWGKNNEWKYFLHGGGCRVTHTITGEIVDWDAPDLYQFDPYWFAGWLAWCLSQPGSFLPPIDEKAVLTASALINEQNEDVFRKKIFVVLEELHQQGKLLSFPDQTNKYKLII